MPVNLGSAGEMRWDGRADEVRHIVVAEDGSRVVCRISRRAIEDDLGNPKTPEACLDAAQEHFDRLTDEWLVRIGRKQFEPDGTVLIRTGDLPPPPTAA